MGIAKTNGATQRDIAKAVDLAQSTVAFALNPRTAGKLLPETVALIQAKAKELNYRPQSHARILSTGRSNIIGVVYCSAPYHAPQERIKHLARAAIVSGYQLVAIDVDWFPKDRVAAHNYLQDLAAEGVIFCNISAEDQMSWRQTLRKRSLPFVSMAGGPDVMDQAQSDLFSAFRSMAEHHIAQGGRKLGFLLSYHDELPKGKRPSPGLNAKVNGFVEAVKASGGQVTVDAEYEEFFRLPSKPRNSKNNSIEGRVIYPLRTGQYRNVFDLGFHEMNRLLGDDACVPDSLLCSNDDIATGAIAACVERRIAVPEIIRISGADNAPFTNYCSVPLSTIEQPSQRMAEWSIQRLVELIENPAIRQSTSKAVFPCELIIRESTMLGKGRNHGEPRRP